VIYPVSLDITDCRAAHARLLVTIRAVSEEQLREPSLLPGWTRAHVLGHLVGNAGSVTRRLSAAAEGRAVDQYPSGMKGRTEEIEDRSRLSAEQLVEDVRTSSAEVDSLFASYPEDAWDNPIRSVDGPDSPARQLAFTRFCEVEIHHVDLALGYEAQDWPPSLIERLLPTVLADLPERAGAVGLLGWLVGRAPAPTLTPWD
jgi:maleylpyruvate isomerase